eukprot:TRINITY_DN13983_c0_g1_i1.p1 TRINITY_DN13983_c0_g1~~TRINITY_DN13983_c0_g1_i1.p1  ORF type:complete len:238 (+),score=29.06 TRINITY_DN13983_c0_g1_i1:90-803(+)
MGGSQSNTIPRNWRLFRSGAVPIDRNQISVPFVAVPVASSWVWELSSIPRRHRVVQHAGFWLLQRDDLKPILPEAVMPYLRLLAATETASLFAVAPSSSTIPGFSSAFGFPTKRLINGLRDYQHYLIVYKMYVWILAELRKMPPDDAAVLDDTAELRAKCLNLANRLQTIPVCAAVEYLCDTIIHSPLARYALRRHAGGIATQEYDDNGDEVSYGELSDKTAARRVTITRLLEWGIL